MQLRLDCDDQRSGERQEIPGRFVTIETKRRGRGRRSHGKYRNDPWANLREICTTGRSLSKLRMLKQIVVFIKAN